MEGAWLLKKFRRLAITAGIVCACNAVHVAWALDAGTPDAGIRDGGPFVDAGNGDGASSVMDAALPPPTHFVGKACKKDGDCAPGLTCLSPATDSLGKGGPAGGLCTVSCADKGQDDCNRVDTASVCATSSGGLSHCYETCAIGPVTGGAPKCHDRADVVCAPTRTSVDVCAPMCRGNDDCPGRVCNPASGLCANAVTGTLPVGSPCDPSSTTTTCIGGCETLGNGAPTMDNSLCTYSCALGRPGACGQSLTGSGRQVYGCVIKSDPTATDGDLGECGQLCDCDSDCTNPGFICHENPVGQSAGRAGACVPRLTFDGVTAGMPCGVGRPPRMDAGAPVDAAVPLDAPDDGSPVVTPVSAGGGCSCRTASGGSGRSAALLSAFAALAWFRRRNARHTLSKRS